VKIGVMIALDDRHSDFPVTFSVTASSHTSDAQIFDDVLSPQRTNLLDGEFAPRIRSPALRKTPEKIGSGR
jgi:hypothetical protein